MNDSSDAYAAAAAHSHTNAASSTGAAQQAAASSSFLASAAAPVAAARPRKHKRERKVADLTPALVAHHRSGWSRLLRVTDFVASHRRLTASLQSSLSLLNHPRHAAAVDLSVGDLKVETPFAKIDRAISEEVAVALDYQAAHKRARDEAKAAQQQQLRMDETGRMQQQQQAAMMNNAASLGAGSAATQMQIAKMQLQQLQQQQQQQQQQPAAPAASASDPFAMEDPSHAPAPDHMQLDMPPILAERSTHGSGEEEHGHDAHAHNHAAAAASSSAAAAASSSASAAAASSMDHSDDLQDTQPVLSSQASMMLSQQTDATVPAASAAADAADAAAASSFFGGGSAHIDSLSAVAASAHSAPLINGGVTTTLLTPPGFGSRVPKYNDLMEPLKTLLADRAHALGKRGRLEANCVTPRSMEHEKRRHAANQPAVPLDPEEVLLRVSVYHPTLHSKMQEFLVCGSQYLTVLRDRLYCLNDLTLDGPSTPSACFFIEGCFYDDLRHPRAIRLSDTIVEWVRAEGRYTQPTLAHFDQRPMESTRFSDLSLRLGAHYLYQHQGDCAHTIVFTQMRMAHSSDDQNQAVYPLKVFQGKTQRQPCGVCRVYSARYVTYGDKMADASPFFWCDACYRPMHYSREGELLYSDFQVFEYEHD